MITVIILVFILGYIAITMEHGLKIDKLIPALLMMTISWALIAFNLDGITHWLSANNPLDISSGSPQVGKWLGGHEEKLEVLNETVLHHFGKTAEILIFLMGAMAIVEMIDHFEGFSAIKNLIKTKSKRKLLWIISFLAFFLSSIIDNLTATIVLITILRKIFHSSNDRIWYAGFIIIAANAGGAWTPIGDVTTTMLWMAGKVTSVKLIELLFIPSLLNILIPLLLSYFLPVFKGEIAGIKEEKDKNRLAKLMLFLGLGLIVFVPVFKTITHLPPYLGMMLSLSLFALVSEIVSNRKFKLQSSNETHHHGPTLKALSKIEIPSVLFFLGILMTVAALESLGVIFSLGQSVKTAGISENVFIIGLGIASAVIDNVPLVAASLGMFQIGPDASVWHFIAYAAGTGGSILIIGSAAGVVAMGMEKISFGWYFKKIAPLALLGYLAGIAWFLIFN